MQSGLSDISQKIHVRVQSLHDRLDPIDRLCRHYVRLVEQNDIRKLDLVGQTVCQSGHNDEQI